MAMSVEILLHDEVQLIDWGESRAGGPWVKFRLNDPEMLAIFRGMDTAKINKTGHILNLTVAQGDIAQVEDFERQQAAIAPYGEQARSLRLSSFFRTLGVWRAVGSDEDYLAWVRLQPSAYSGKFSEYTSAGEGRCEAAHVRRVSSGAGTGIKPPFSAIPLTGEEHKLQSTQGESALNPQDWWDKKRIEYVQQWCWQSLRTELGYQHWSEAPPERLRQWAVHHDVDKYLPREYRDAES